MKSPTSTMLLCGSRSMSSIRRVDIGVDCNRDAIPERGTSFFGEIRIILNFRLTQTDMTVYSVKTEITGITMSLTDLQKKFILHWGEMGTRWGINRTVAQIHALLYLSPKPL